MYLNNSKLQSAIRQIRDDFYERVKTEIIARPDSTYREIAEQLGVSSATVQRVATCNNLSRPTGPRPKGRDKQGGSDER